MIELILAIIFFIIIGIVYVIGIWWMITSDLNKEPDPNEKKSLFERFYEDDSYKCTGEESD